MYEGREKRRGGGDEGYFRLARGAAKLFIKKFKGGQLLRWVTVK